MIGPQSDAGAKVNNIRFHSITINRRHMLVNSILQKNIKQNEHLRGSQNNAGAKALCQTDKQIPVLIHVRSTYYANNHAFAEIKQSWV